MWKFTASVFLGFAFTIYGTVFGMLSMSEPFYLIPGQPYYAVAMLAGGLLSPIVGYLCTTEQVTN